MARQPFRTQKKRSNRRSRVHRAINAAPEIQGDLILVRGIISDKFPGNADLIAEAKEVGATVEAAKSDFGTYLDSKGKEHSALVFSRYYGAYMVAPAAIEQHGEEKFLDLADKYAAHEGLVADIVASGTKSADERTALTAENSVIANVPRFKVEDGAVVMGRNGDPLPPFTMANGRQLSFGDMMRDHLGVPTSDDKGAKNYEFVQEAVNPHTGTLGVWVVRDSIASHPKVAELLESLSSPEGIANAKAAADYSREMSRTRKGLFDGMVRIGVERISTPEARAKFRTELNNGPGLKGDKDSFLKAYSNLLHNTQRYATLHASQQKRFDQWWVNQGLPVKGVSGQPDENAIKAGSDEAKQVAAAKRQFGLVSKDRSGSYDSMSHNAMKTCYELASKDVESVWKVHFPNADIKAEHAAFVAASQARKAATKEQGQGHEQASALNA